MRAVVVAAFAILAATSTAYAYPQFQLARDQTCSGCHLSPAGGGLLNENGLGVAEDLGQLSGKGAFFYGKVKPPSWLVLGGDLRAAGGYDKPSDVGEFVVFPMQAELYVRAQSGHFALTVNAGAREPEQTDSHAPDDFKSNTYFWSREHYVSFQLDEGGTTGLWIRAGRFLPVFGLRLVEHQTYIRRYGPVPFNGEAYGVALEYIEPKYEVHVTAFRHDSLWDVVQEGDGAAVYAEARPKEKVAVGVEGMFVSKPDDRQMWGGVTGKYLATDKLVLQAEVQYGDDKLFASPGRPQHVNAYALGTYQLGAHYLLDVGLGYSTENAKISDLDRDGVDVDLHWFMSSHLEFLLVNHAQVLAFGNAGDAEYYSLLMAHYRL
jgi:hypothetical protein